jgi:hypothetical protein
LQKLESPVHVLVGHFLRRKRIHKLMIRLQLSERPSIWIVDKVKSVGSRSGVAKYLVAFVVFKHKMNVQFGRVTFNTILIFGCL